MQHQSSSKVLSNDKQREKVNILYTVNTQCSHCRHGYGATHTYASLKGFISKHFVNEGYKLHVVKACVNALAGSANHDSIVFLFANLSGYKIVKLLRHSKLTLLQKFLQN